MVTTFEVLPGRRLGPVAIGATANAVLEVLGSPTNVVEERSYFWERPALRVDLDAAGAVEFVELTWRDDGPQVVHAGIDLLGEEAEAVADALAAEGAHLEEDGYSLTCPGLALWRPVLPGDADNDVSIAGAGTGPLSR